jgi:hypothetical protein
MLMPCSGVICVAMGDKRALNSSHRINVKASGGAPKAFRAGMKQF